MTTIKVVAGAVVDWTSTPQIHGKAISQIALADSLLQESGLDVQSSVFDERVGAIVVVNLELPVASSRKRQIVLPSFQV